MTVEELGKICGGMSCERCPNKKECDKFKDILEENGIKSNLAPEEFFDILHTELE